MIWHHRFACEPTTHLVLGILVGAGIQQSLYAVIQAILCGTKQRRRSTLYATSAPMAETDR